MALAPGKQLGPYQILTMIGAGGMGEVYKAQDTRLDRTVAVKVLPAHFSDNAEMHERFEREARAIASLNHPHICVLHDIGRESAIDFLVMEYLEGQTLAERIERGPLPVGETLKLAIQIADALDKAHAQGVTHRDLKPSNIMITATGAKLLDFGLAKFKPTASAVSLSQAPTRAEVTTPGTIVGTVQYMAPEQLEEKEADARTDIFAFGMILYEMLSGKKAFDGGKSRAVLIASILTADPAPITQTQPAVSPALEHTISRCLAKDPEERWQTAHDVVLKLRWIAGGGAEDSSSEASAVHSNRERRTLILAAAVALLGFVLAIPAYRYLWGADEAEEFQLRAPLQGLNSESISISPDGANTAVVLRPGNQGSSALYVRPVGSITTRKLAGTDDALQPFWSPDSRFIGFVSGGKLKTVAASGGSPKEICPVTDFSGGAWNKAGTIILGTPKGLFKVSAEGGTPETLTSVEKTESGHYWPAFLTDGRRYVYLAWSGEADKRAIVVGSLDSKERKRVIAADSNPAYAPGYLLFHRGATLFAAAFNGNAEPGEPVHIADGVSFNPANGLGSFAVSQAGTLIYFQGGNAAGAPIGRGRIVANVQYGWMSSGNIQGAGEAGNYGDFDVSPDGKLIAVTRQDAGAPGADIWVIDWQRAGVTNRLTTDPADDINPVFSADGKRVAFTTYRKGNADIYVINSDGVGGETPLLDSPINESIEAWSHDGRYIAYLSGQDEFQDIYALPISADGKPDEKEKFAVVSGRFHKDEPQFSPDGKWLAFTSDKTGRFEVYVTSFPGHDREIQISRDGGGQPRWRPKEGNELAFRSLDNRLMGVTFKASGKVDPSAPQFIVNAPLNGNLMVRDPTRHQFAFSPDGQNALLGVPAAAVQGGGLQAGVSAIVNPGVGSDGGLPIDASLLAGRNRGFRGGGRGGLSNGFTVILNWPASLRKAAK